MRIKDEVGNRYGRLTVISFSHRSEGKMKAAYWVCKCDCGQTAIIRGTHLRYGNSKSCGCLNSEAVGAAGRLRTGEKSQSWKGGRRKTGNGYIYVYCPSHPRSNKGAVFEHILVMEKMLGHSIPEGAVVHHCNADRSDNRPYNLRLFPSHSEHQKYHNKLRLEALAVGTYYLDTGGKDA